jgi:hypothetical protein
VENSKAGGVRLKPMQVIKIEDKFNENLGDYVGVKGHHDEKRNWRRECLVVLNGESGKVLTYSVVLLS